MHAEIIKIDPYERLTISVFRSPGIMLIKVKQEFKAHPLEVYISEFPIGA